MQVTPLGGIILRKIWKLAENCEEKETENEININFSCNKYDNIRRKAFNNIYKLDNIKLQIGNKVEKLKLLFAKGPFNFQKS